jgi:hypothetical protein
MMVLRAVAIALLAVVAAPAVPAAAEETAPQKLFRKRLMNDRLVTKDVKRTLRNGGFVDRNIRFADLTGDTRSDALVTVNQGGSAGRIAVYVYSSHGSRMGQGGSASPLRIIYRKQTLYRARAGLKRATTERPNGAFTFRQPVFDPGDTLDDPGAWRQVEMRWRPKRSRFGREETKTIDNVRSRYCSKSGDFCTRTVEDKRGRTYLELETPSFSGRYFLCVTTPAGDTDCRAFTLRRSGDVFLSSVRWVANFPDEGRGRYGVTWRLGQQQLGPELGFRRPK